MLCMIAEYPYKTKKVEIIVELVMNISSGLQLLQYLVE